MRDRKSIGPQQWSQDVVDRIAQKKENNTYPKVDQKMVDRWDHYLQTSRDGDRDFIQKVLKT